MLILTKKDKFLKKIISHEFYRGCTVLTNQQNDVVLETILEKIELPESAYKKAEERYEDLGGWFDREASSCRDFDTHIFPQGSFRLGTAIRPLSEKEEYDLDLACELRAGITKESHTQKDLKRLVGNEIEAYRVARGIKVPIVEKHRCWRLEYQDGLGFHMDIVPCIPQDAQGQRFVFASMKNVGESEAISAKVAPLTISITDDRHSKYSVICSDWNISNPEGYAKWFESRINQNSLIVVAKAQVDSLPMYKYKSPLQRVVQILKRHRDQMFKNDEEVKPISIIITTLAGRAYQGETSIFSALENIVGQMGRFVQSQSPRVPNPVNPKEDFADRWAMPKYRHLKLEDNFWAWLKQLQSDFHLLASTEDVPFLIKQAEQKFSTRMNAVVLGNAIGIKEASISIVTPKKHTIVDPPRPWRREDY